MKAKYQSELETIHRIYVGLPIGGSKTVCVQNRSYEVANANGHPRVTRCQPHRSIGNDFVLCAQLAL